MSAYISLFSSMVPYSYGIIKGMLGHVGTGWDKLGQAGTSWDRLEQGWSKVGARLGVVVNGLG